MMEPIRFYRPEHPYGCCSNYSPHAVTVDDLTFTTSEHFYQWYKHFRVGATHAELIRLAQTPGRAWRLANDRRHPQRPDWEQIKDDVMRLVVLLKFMQHEECTRELLATGDLMLVEASPRDAYWGEGEDRTGKNMLGIVLMEVRDAIRNGSPDAYEREVRARLAAAR